MTGSAFLLLSLVTSSLVAVPGARAFDFALSAARSLSVAQGRSTTVPGHDDLHVRTMWLNVHTGGDVPNGNCVDQMALTTGGLPGACKR